MASDEKILEHILNPSAPLGFPSVSNGAHDEPPKSPQDIEAKKLELKAVKLAEENQFDEAEEILNKALTLSPTMPSLLNNRAQVYRLQGRADDAFEDLTNAIELSKGVGDSAKQAFSQRGMIHMLRGNEDAARSDFEKSAALGGKFAACQAAKMNPYAKLCNQMLSRAMDELQ